MATKKSQAIALPLLPLRDVVIFPHMVIPLFVGRIESIKALEEAMANDKQLFLVAQKNAAIDSPTSKEIYNTGTVATILQMLRLPDGTVKVLVEGAKRAKLKSIKEKQGYLIANIKIVEDVLDMTDVEAEVMVRNVFEKFEKLVEVNEKIPRELLTSLSNIEAPGRLADSIAAHMSVRIESRQEILRAIDVRDRLDLLSQQLDQELELVEVEKRVQGRVKQQVEKSQRQYYLSEKIKAIQQELGDLDEGGVPVDEMQQLQDRIEKSGMSKEAMQKAKAELSKLKMMPPMSAEATVCRNYLDALLSVPWKKASRVTASLEKAESILEADHYGLEEVKQRILEYLAVQLRVKKLKGPILCLVGPPGVGKTSLGQSIADATGRKFARISLGGVRDEAEIRGHRRTYIGAMPGKIIQKMSKVEVRNPLFMLDEVDKMAADFRGDPASALLEVLDPEQNHSFNDHYLEVDYDLSDVMFVATANSLDIPIPLLDRMEIIRIAGYTEDEKFNIAIRYLVPRQIERTGLKDDEFHISEGALREIIRCYTREAGVRGLERAIAKICRKVVKEILLHQDKKKKVPAASKTSKKAKTASKVKVEKTKTAQVTQRNLEKYLGVKKYRFGLAEEFDQIGQVTGLAWTEVGGELLTIESQVVPGKGKSLHTGRLGEVMQESIHAAMTVVRSRAASLGIDDEYFQKNDFHVHVPEGATPKDGPSAGIGMCTSLISAMTQIPVHADVAMTGEITLRGEVLPIGGLKEKLLAALRGGIKVVIIPKDNERDLKEIPKIVTEGMKIHPVKWIDEVLEIALQSMPDALVAKKEVAKAKVQRKKATNKRGGARAH